MFDKVRRALQSLAAGWAKAPSRKEALTLDADEWRVKQKLGAAFFRKRLTPNSRVARILSLDDVELDIARRKGWLR